MSMFPIASVQGNGSGAIYFNNIPQTFTHLQIRISGRGGTSSTFSNLYTNWYGTGSASTFSDHILYGNGSAASSTNHTGLGYIFSQYAFPAATSTTGIMGSTIIDILDYTNTNKYKTLRILSGNDQNGNGQVALSSGLIQYSGAITTGYIDTEGSFTTATRADLYGIQTSNATGA